MYIFNILILYIGKNFLEIKTILKDSLGSNTRRCFLSRSYVKETKLKLSQLASDNAIYARNCHELRSVSCWSIYVDLHAHALTSLNMHSLNMLENTVIRIAC